NATTRSGGEHSNLPHPSNQLPARPATEATRKSFLEGGRPTRAHDACTSFRKIETRSLKIQRQLSRIFDAFLYFDHERDGFFAIDGAVIVAECEVHHRAQLHFAIHCHGSLHDFVHAKNSA